MLSLTVSLPQSSIINTLLLALILSTILFAQRILINYVEKYGNSKNQAILVWLKFIKNISFTPLLFLLFIDLIDILLFIGFHYLHISINNKYFNYPQSIGFFESLIIFWIIFNSIREGKNYLLQRINVDNHKILNLLLPTIMSSSYFLILLIMINTLLPLFDLSFIPELITHKIIKICLIIMCGWLLYQIVNAVEKFLINQYVSDNNDFVTARKINTQLIIIKRIIVSLLVVIVFASILMVFDSVKSLGTGLITTAGIISAIGAFASQQSLSRIFAGLTIAFTQPFKIGDTVIVENELGQVEEISLSYIVIKLWDLRRLILPTDQIMSKGLQNLTRETTDLLGVIYLYVDYTLPVNVVRKKYIELLNSSPLWDKKISALQVTDAKLNCMEIRGLMSASNSGNLWELRCYMREQLINYIVNSCPDCLSKIRNVNLNVSAGSPQQGHESENERDK